jgi:hypothetical protein
MAKLPSFLPRSLRREYSRFASKLAFRQVNNLWEFPITRRDYEFNLRLRREGLLLDDVLEAFTNGA